MNADMKHFEAMLRASNALREISRDATDISVGQFASSEQQRLLNSMQDMGAPKDMLFDLIATH